MTGSGSAGAGFALSELAGLLLSTDSFTDLVHGLAELSVRTVEPAATCGITLTTDDRVMTVAAADDLAAELDEQQYEHDAGPCVQALYAGEVVDAPDLSVESRWGSYPRIARSHGIEAVLSTPLIVDGRSIGVLNLYSRSSHSFEPHHRQLAALLAGQAAIAIIAALRHYDEVTLTDNLRIALASRSVIDQAIGIVMARRRCTPSDAFASLRAVSQRRNTKLRVVAADLVSAAGPAE